MPACSRTVLYSPRTRSVELGDELAGVADPLEVRPLALDMAEQGLGPRLVGGGRGAPEPLHDRARGHELAGRSRCGLASSSTWGLPRSACLVATGREARGQLYPADGPACGARLIHASCWRAPL